MRNSAGISAPAIYWHHATAPFSYAMGNMGRRADSGPMGLSLPQAEAAKRRPGEIEERSGIMRRRTVRGDTDSPEQYGDCDAVLCRDVTFSQDGRSVTVRRGTRLSEAVRQLPAAIAERRRIRFEVLEPGPDDLGQAEASRQVAAALTGSGIELDGPHQGQMNLRAARTGLLRIDPVKVV